MEFPVFNEHKQMVLGETNKQSTDYIMLNHYWSKSYEEFVERCNRGEVIGGTRDIRIFLCQSRIYDC